MYECAHDKSQNYDAEGDIGKITCILIQYIIFIILNPYNNNNIYYMT